MATYKPIRKTASGTEEIKIPYAVLADAPDLSKFVKTNTANTFTETQGIADGKHLKTNLIKSADDSKWIAEITAAGLEIGGSGTPLRFYSSTRPVVANQNKELAYTSDIPAAVTESTVSGWGFTKNKGTVTSVAVKMNGETKGTVTSSGTIDLGTVLTNDGGTINKSKTVKMDASANSDGANLKWGTVNSKNPYIGYASDQTDGTFVVGSLLGTNYASGLTIGGGSGNLLWKGAKVATTSDIPDISGKLDKTAFSLSGTTLTITI